MTADVLQKTIRELGAAEGTVCSMDVGLWAEQYMDVYVEAYKNKEITEFYQESRAFSAQLEALWEYFEIDNNIEHKKIYYFAVIDTVRNLGQKIAELNSEKSGEYGNYKYIYPILEVLYRHGTVSVGKIAELLQVERHTLTNAIRRAAGFGLWNQKKQGRNSLYQITARGERAYIDYLKRNIVSDLSSLDEILLVFAKEIEAHMSEAHPDVNEIIRKLNCRLGGCGCSSTMLKLSLQDIYRKREEFVRKLYNLKKEYNRSSRTSAGYVPDRENIYRYSRQPEYWPDLY